MDTANKNKTAIHEFFVQFLQQKEQYETRITATYLEDIRKHIEPEFRLNMTELHTIACIGEQEPINVTSIAERINLSKGNTSKITNKLLKAGWVRKAQLNDNKKEVYFRLTPVGKKLFAAHDELHTKEKQRMYEFLERYNESELEFIKRLFGDMVDFYR
ncbi:MULTISPECIES: MarR family transcriptional regulator [Paenibacillus]|uniref:Transcriptional regulator n=1 Tax=Paenibacillus elgii TaxID=189691 RepID=A0A163W5A0_9BACL|nr:MULTISPECIES: MarR family transcriptional regulator [Paenibacillus]KZE75876.1 transcriptional regulator [Paenibacillus elgii]MCP1307769.1 MarR family transcriptional regulator [Paenibacillus tyrfis]